MLSGMKSTYFFKFLFVAVLGGLFAAFIHGDEEKWNRLGREAFLAYQSGKFDQSIASPAPLVAVIVIVVLFAVGLAACYEFCGFMGEKLLSRSQGKSELPNSAVERP
jgi:hypothetical protein